MEGLRAMYTAGLHHVSVQTKARNSGLPAQDPHSYSPVASLASGPIHVMTKTPVPGRQQHTRFLSAAEIKMTKRTPERTGGAATNSTKRKVHFVDDGDSDFEDDGFGARAQKKVRSQADAKEVKDQREVPTTTGRPSNSSLRTCSICRAQGSSFLSYNPLRKSGLTVVGELQ